MKQWKANGIEYGYVDGASLAEATELVEFDALKAVSDQYPKLVLSLDRVDLSQDGIVHRYLPDFLLEAEFAQQDCCRP